MEEKCMDTLGRKGQAQKPTWEDFDDGIAVTTCCNLLAIFVGLLPRDSKLESTLEKFIKTLFQHLGRSQQLKVSLCEMHLQIDRRCDIWKSTELYIAVA
jgi:hypothetical protein